MAFTSAVTSPVRLVAFARLAARLDLSPSSAVLLPTVVEVAARKAGWLEPRFVDEVFRNDELRDYVAERIAYIATTEAGREAIRDFEARA